MIFGIVILLLALAVAYFHYAQGFFSATLSCIFTIIAAVVAVSYHETVIASLLKGGMANIAESSILVVLFVAVYVILRTIFDRTIPGNVRYPLLVDKIGAGIVGLIAGLFAAGILAIAAQALPFGPTIAGFSRFTVLDRDVVLPGTSSQQDSVTFDEMKDTSLDPKNEHSLLVPVDQLVVSTVDRLSTGALDNGNPLDAVHPDWMTELFGQRVGVQVGAKRVAYDLPGLQNTSLGGVFKMDSIPEIDAEYKSVREGTNHDMQALAADKGDTLKVPPDQTLLTVRVHFDASATDEDNKVRFSCASTRLVGWNDSTGTKVYTDYTPIGTLEDAYVLYRNKPDDPLVCEGNKDVDFVFQVPMDDVFKPADPKAPERIIKDGVFIDVKRMAQMDLSNKVVSGAPTFDNNVAVMRKPLDQAKRFPKRGAHGEMGPQVTATGPITVATNGMKQTNLLFTKVNPGAYQGEQARVDFKGGSATINNKQFQKIRLDGSQTVAALGQGDFAIGELYTPPGKKIVEVVGKPTEGRDPWEWSNFLTFTIADADANQYKCIGGFAELNKDGGEPRAIGNFDSEGNAVAVDHSNDSGRPMQVWLIFIVPDNVTITQLQFDNQTIYAHQVKVP